MSKALLAVLPGRRHALDIDNMLVGVRHNGLVADRRLEVARSSNQFALFRVCGTYQRKNLKKSVPHIRYFLFFWGGGLLYPSETEGYRRIFWDFDIMPHTEDFFGGG